jgi:surface protein
MAYMFDKCKNFDQPLNNWDVSNVTSMEGMFEACIMFCQSIDNWDVSNVETIEGIFEGCDLFINNQNISEWIIKNPKLESEISNKYPTLLTNYRDEYVLK